MQRATYVFLALLTGFTASKLVAAEAGPDFKANGLAFIKANCLDCHSGKEPKAELSLEKFTDSQSLIQNRRVWENILRMITAGEMPPEDYDQPKISDREAFVQHVHSIFEYAEQHAASNPGRVTMRRLNQKEYRNTIRDLIGVDFDPTTDFPSDDIGYGFDNNGDVLSISPVHMERYLAAADNIMQRAILPAPTAPPKRHLSTRYAEPASGEVGEKAMEKNWRRLETDGAAAINVGPLNTPYEWRDDGEYVFRTRACVKRGEAVRLVVLVSGKNLAEKSSDEELDKIAGNVIRPAKILKIFDLTASKMEEAQTFEVKLPAMVGRERMLVGLMKPSEGKPAAAALVEYLALEGPMDTRPASHRRLLASPEGQSESQRTRHILNRFASRAYRRPATEAEVERLASMVDSTVATGEKWEVGMQLAMQAVLCSPKFLFRVELDDTPTSPEPESLNEFQLASRLSYFLWSSMPDEQLFALANQGKLSAQLQQQVDRMLADPKSSAFVRSFALQWLQLERLEGLAPDGSKFPAYNRTLGASMLRETELLFDSVMREDRSILDLITADYTFLNEPLGKLYGIVDTNGNRTNAKPERPGGKPLKGEEFQRVSLQDQTRGGILTQASVMTVTSNPTRTSPVKRGRWVLEQILGAPPPPPPPNVPQLPEGEKSAEGGSLRERLEIHRRDPSCANCHAKMDPIGFALENYDAIGAYRTRDGKFEIDNTGELIDGTKLAGIGDLKQAIVQKREEFARCMTEKMLIYALGRGIEYYDRRPVEQILEQLAANDYRFSTLVSEIVKSEPFRRRRGMETQ